MKVKFWLLAIMALCVGQGFQAQQTYRNPVIDHSTPDPTVIKADDGSYYLYATEDIRNVPIYKSKDLVHWDYVGTVFTNRTRPTFVEKGGIWAPSIHRVNGKYVLYYAMSVWGGEWGCGIGRAIADNPEGPFVDCGKMFISSEIDVKNSIDPFYIEEDGSGKKFLIWGSFHGLYAVELSDDGLSIRQGAHPIRVAGNAYEGMCIYRHGRYYYLFASIGSCCNGAQSTYTTVVGRSRDLLGPYVDKEGRSMMDNHHEVLIQGNKTFVGTGHNAEITTDGMGDNWILYHAFKLADPDMGRVLMLDRIHWVDEWPYVEGVQPSSVADVPKF